MPYVGILSEKRSFSTTITPMLDLKFDQTITSLDLQDISCHNNNSTQDWKVNRGNVIVCPDKNEIFFLYPYKKKSSIQFDVQNDKHSFIRNSKKITLFIRRQEPMN